LSGNLISELIYEIVGVFINENNDLCFDAPGQSAEEYWTYRYSDTRCHNACP